MVVGAGLFGKVVRRLGRSVSTCRRGEVGRCVVSGALSIRICCSLLLLGAAGPPPPPPLVGTGRDETGRAGTRVCWAGWVCCSSGWSRGECCQRSAGGRRGRGGSSPGQRAPWECLGSGTGRGGSRSGFAARSLSSCKSIILILSLTRSSYLGRGLNLSSEGPMGPVSAPDLLMSPRSASP